MLRDQTMEVVCLKFVEVEVYIAKSASFHHGITIPPFVPTVPADPKSCNITLSYNQQSGKLLFINSTWATVPVSYTASDCLLITE